MNVYLYPNFVYFSGHVFSLDFHPFLRNTTPHPYPAEHRPRFAAPSATCSLSVTQLSVVHCSSNFICERLCVNFSTWLWQIHQISLDVTSAAKLQLNPKKISTWWWELCCQYASIINFTCQLSPKIFRQIVTSPTILARTCATSFFAQIDNLFNDRNENPKKKIFYRH